MCIKERQIDREHGATSLIQVYDLVCLYKELDMLLPELTDVTTSALGKTPEDIREEVGKFKLLIIIREGGRIVGYGGYDIENVDGVGVVLDESKMVQRGVQGKGYGRSITQEALILHPEASCLTFSSQNPSQIESVRKALLGKKLAPIDVTYKEDEGMRKILKEIATQTGKTDIDLVTGVRKGIYFGERFGDYTINLSKPNIAFIERRLEATGFNRNAGDGVFCLAKLA